MFSKNPSDHKALAAEGLQMPWLTQQGHLFPCLGQNPPTTEPMAPAPKTSQVTVLPAAS